jgi:alpha-mannosidase
VAWAFTKEEYLWINEGILEDALKLMETSDFKFSLEQTFLLEALEESNPALWQKLKEMIKKGKLEIVDGQYLMPDTMLPVGEVLVREILFGKRYCQEKFGIDVPVAWAADSFGMNAQLPQIYRKAGYKWLALRRGINMEITQSEFWWKGLDGTTILTHWMPMGYRAGLMLDELEQSLVTLNKYAATEHILMPCGSGSIPPQPEIPQVVHNWNKTHPDAMMKLTTPEEFFLALEQTGEKLGVVEEELYDSEFMDIFPQVCTSRIWIIHGMRKYEALIMTAEKFATIAWLLGAEYPSGKLHQAWKNVLYLAFHDIVSGCGIDEIYEDVREIFDSLSKELHSILDCSLTHITSKIATQGKATVIFNPLARRVENWVESKHSLHKICSREDTTESNLVTENSPARSVAEVSDLRTEFVADITPLGYRVFHRSASEKKPDDRNRKIKINGEKVETPFFELTIDKNTGIIDILDKDSGLLIKGNELFIDDEIGDLYYHRSRFADLIKSEGGEGLKYGSFRPKAFKIEKGALKTRIIFENEYYCLTWPYRLKDKFPPKLYKSKALDICKEVIVFRDIPRIEFVTKIDNKYPNIRLSVKFDTGIIRKTFTRETQFGVITEPTEHFINGEEGFEPSGVPNFMNWFDLSDGIHGIAFMNKGLPAVWIQGGSVYIRLLRSVNGLSADGKAGPLVPTPDALELKPFIFEYALQFHKGDWRQSQIYQRAQEYCQPLLPIPARAEGTLPSVFSFLELSPGNLLLSALKKAEDSEEVILRFFETEGIPTRGKVKAFREIKRAVVVDLLEKEQEELPICGNCVEIEVKPFEIVSLKLKL